MMGWAKEIDVDTSYRQKRCPHGWVDVTQCKECAVRDRLDVLEREHSEFFDRWHGERRKREKLMHDVERCHQMLLSEPDTKAALFKAENILREALAEQKVGGTAEKMPNVEFSGGAPLHGAASAGTQG